MHYGRINKNDIANGKGVRVTLFVSGCRHHCEGCFNPETWNFSYGDPYTKEVEDEVIEALAPDHIAGGTYAPWRRTDGSRESAGPCRPCKKS